MPNVIVKCGWCITGHHVDCKKETAWNETSWSCDCECGQGEYA
jgi:hypothetical protein